MKFHEIDTVGNIWIQRLATKPAWGSADEGRIIFTQDNNTMYYGTDTGWTSSFVFKNIAVAGQATVVALNDDDTLTFVSGTGITVTTNVGAQSVTITTKDTEIVHADTIGAVGTKTHATIDAHIDSKTQHQATGEIVGTTNSQTLTNKTLTTPTIVAAGWSNANHTHVDVPTGGIISHNSLSDKGTTSHANVDAHIASETEHGATGKVVGTNNSQTLYNKTLITPVIASFANATHNHMSVAGGGILFVSGAKIWIYENDATKWPGWSISASSTDAVIAVKGSTGAYNVAGGTQAGTWSQPTHTHAGVDHLHTGGEHTHDTSSHVLTYDEIPAHRHQLAWSDPGVAGPYARQWGFGSYTGSAGWGNTTPVGGGLGHDHGATASASGYTGASDRDLTVGANATASTYRPLAHVGIIIVKA